MVPALVLGLAFGIIMMVVFSPKMAREASDASAQSNSTAVVSERADSTASPVATSADNTTTPQESVATPASTPANEKATSEETTSSGPELSMDGLVVRQHPVDENEVIPSLGGLLDPDKAKMEILFTRVGGGIESITFSNIWETAAAKRQAEAYFAAEARGSVEGYSLPSDDQRFVLRRMQAVPYAGQSIKISLMAASGLQVQWNEGDESVSLKNPLPLLSALYWHSCA